MTRLVHVLFACVAITAVRAAPSHNAESNIANVESEKPVETLLSIDEESKNQEHGQRQKRWYNFYGYGFPPINPFAFTTPPPFYQRQDNPFLEIYRRLKDITDYVNQPDLPGPQLPPQIPVYLPVLFVPNPLNCNCGANQNPSLPPADNNGTVDINTRFPEMDDTRQNWGFAIDESSADDDKDYRRPVSFNPITPETPLNRPPPPVEHGSNQADSSNLVTTTTTPAPPDFSTQGPITPTETLTGCDNAILVCCHQPELSYDCFANLGCPDPVTDPCQVTSILDVLSKFRRFYGARFRLNIP